MFDSFADDPEFAEILPEMTDEEMDWFTILPMVKSTIHGYAFENMF